MDIICVICRHETYVFYFMKGSKYLESVFKLLIFIISYILIDNLYMALVNGVILRKRETF